MKKMMMLIFAILINSLPIAGEKVEGPYVLSESGEIGSNEINLHYTNVKRSSKKTVALDSHGRVHVDVGIVGHGVEAYIALVPYLVVLDTESKETLWSRRVGMWYQTLSFISATDEKSGEEIVLIRIGGKDGSGRFFEVSSGDEKFLRVDGENYIASNEDDKKLRGTPINIIKQIPGKNCEIQEPKGVRFTNKEEWEGFWPKYHKGVVPEINFGENMVVGIYYGRGINCNGVEAEIALDCEDSIELFVDGLYYQTIGKGDKVTAFGYFVLPKTDKKILIKKDVQGLIGAPSNWSVISELPEL